MSKKNIDKLFQEKFKDFNEIPDKKVWGKISHSLNKKKSRRVIPFWWKLGGVAALLAVLFLVTNPFEANQDTAPIISDTEKLNEKDQNDPQDVNADQIENESQIELVDTEAAETQRTNEQEKQETVDSNRATKVKRSDDSRKISNQSTKKSQLASVAPEKNGQTANSKEHKASIIASNRLIESSESPENENTVAAIDKQNEKSKENAIAQKTSIERSEEGLANVSSNEPKEKIVEDKGKKSIYDEIEKQAEEDEALAKSTKDRWSIGANLAPVYFSSFGEGSPIDPAFVNNSKSGELNMSYGLSIAYNISDKLSIRTGVNKVDFGYDTNEVEFSASLQGSLSGRLNNVNYSESAENIVIENKSNFNLALSDRSEVVTNEISRSGVMGQEFGYIEVPVELEYAIIESRFGVNMIGGVSTLFLTNNTVVLNDSDETIQLGEANNLNNVNFSTNVGFGLNYKFSPKVRLNVEPVFKYQLGTFSESSGNFNPFSVGIYSGLNFKF